MEYDSKRNNLYIYNNMNESYQHFGIYEVLQQVKQIYGKRILEI